VHFLKLDGSLVKDNDRHLIDRAMVGQSTVSAA
jgi:hypothetical protein